MSLLPVSKSLSPHAFVDAVRVEACGTVFVLGWNRPVDDSMLHKLQLVVNGQPCPRAAVFRTCRPDVPRVFGKTPPFTGFCIEHHLAPGTVETIELRFIEQGKARTLLHEKRLRLPIYPPHYSCLRDGNEVLHREDIYGHGPPCPDILEEFWELARSLEGSILDLGCGMGALIAKLRGAGVHADGLEIDRPDLRDYILPGVRPFVTLYDGHFPAPYADKSYDYVICTEVLEHIPEYEDALREIQRIARRGLLLTVPDMEAVPLLHKHDLVPWHLLEGTHVNFFNHRSLKKLLSQYFRKIQLLRIRYAEVNGTAYWNNLAAICREPDEPLTEARG